MSYPDTRRIYGEDTAQAVPVNIQYGETNASNAHNLLANLSEQDQSQFWSFGIGPTEALKYTAIHHAFEQHAIEIPDFIAVIHKEETITYGALNLQASQLASQLREHGVAQGDVVPVFLERGVPMVVGILAALKAGAAYAPQHVNVAPDSQLTYVVNEVSAKVVLTLAKFKEKLQACTGLTCIAIDEFVKQTHLSNNDSSSAASTLLYSQENESNTLSGAMVLFTSGTTGKPNGVKVTHKNLCNILLTTPGSLNIKPGTIVSQLLSISFDMAAWEILGCLANGGTLLVRSKNICETAELANVIISTPSILASISPEKCKYVHTVAVAGEPCPRDLADQWASKATFYNSCGPTETTIVNTMLAHDIESKVLSIGVPTPNNTVYILDENGNPCQIGDTGEMWAGGFAVTAGYLNNPALTNVRYRPDPFLGGNARMFNTRDLGRWTSQGALEHLGRTDDQVKIRGFRVELDSVSTVLEAQSGCIRAVALKLDGRTLIAFMSPLGIDANAAKQAVGAVLPYYCVPSEIHVLPKLPLTSRGKIDKRMLLESALFWRKNASADSASVQASATVPSIADNSCIQATPIQSAASSLDNKMHSALVVTSVLDSTQSDGIKLDVAQSDVAELDSTDLEGAELDSTDLDSAKLESIDIDSAELESTELESTDIDSAELDSTELESTDIDSAELDSTDIDDPSNEIAEQEALRSRRLDKHQITSDTLIEKYKNQALPEAENSISAKLTHHRFYHYWRFVVALAVVNLGILTYGLFASDWWSGAVFRIDVMLNIAVANLTLAILFRQQYVVNLLFKVATSMPLSAPLKIRQLMGKVYHFGGIHVGGAIFGTLWMIAAVSMMFVIAFTDIVGPVVSGLTLLAATQLVVTLLLLVLMAKPTIRQKFHNQFELVHRLGGWFSLIMFWTVALAFIADTHTDIPYWTALSKSPVFWALLLTTVSIILPWLRLKRVPVEFKRPSDHVVLANFDYGVTPFAGSSTTISRSPLTEWHSFANVPSPGKSGFRLTISRAGDWTGKLIDDLPSHLWVKGIPTAGVGNVDQLFKRVVWIATGSGIGPTLPHLLSREVPAHLVWSTRNARSTYGDELVDEIVNVEPNAVIWDTDKNGRPDLVQMAYAAVKEFDAEAVIVIANEKLTRMVVHNMEARGIPAYGAIWDS